jgi:dihydrodiol dehydrogenase / D-xylose 1-dehydrogenase (NADP)
MMCESSEETVIVGTKGRMTIETPGHCPTKLSVKLKSEGRGQVETVVYEYPLPEDTEEIKTAGGYHYPNSTGFIYEAAAVARCIAAGKKEVPQFTLAETLQNLKLIEEIRTQLGVKAVDID